MAVTFHVFKVSLCWQMHYSDRVPLSTSCVENEVFFLHEFAIDVFSILKFLVYKALTLFSAYNI